MIPRLVGCRRCDANITVALILTFLALVLGCVTLLKERQAQRDSDSNLLAEVQAPKTLRHGVEGPPSRTLEQTPNIDVLISEIEPGGYIHVMDAVATTPINAGVRHSGACFVVRLTPEYVRCVAPYSPDELMSVVFTRDSLRLGLKGVGKPGTNGYDLLCKMFSEEMTRLTKQRLLDEIRGR